MRLMEVLLFVLLTLVVTESSLAMDQIQYAGHPVSYWREEIRKPNPTWATLPLSFPLRKNPDPASIPVLLALLEDSDSDVRGLAAACLGHLGARAKPAVASLALALEDPVFFVRREAACALAGIGRGAADACPALRKALNDRDKLIRIFAAQALWCITREPQPSMDTLIQLLRNADAGNAGIYQRQFVYSLLNHMGPKAVDAVPYLIEEVNNKESSGIRARAAETLGHIGPAAHNSVPALRLALHNSDDDIRIHAARSIWLITGNGEEPLPVIIATAKSKDVSVYIRKLAIQSLSELKRHYPKAVQVLRDMQEDPDEEISAATTAALQKGKRD